MSKVMAAEISAACRAQNRWGRGVFPPQVCPYCFGCPIATLVVGISGQGWQREAIPIPDEDVEEIHAWLARVEARISST